MWDKEMFLLLPTYCRKYYETSRQVIKNSPKKTEKEVNLTAGERVCLTRLSAIGGVYIAVSRKRGATATQAKGVGRRGAPTRLASRVRTRRVIKTELCF